MSALKPVVSALLVLAACSTASAQLAGGPGAQPDNARVDVCFTPGGDCADMLVGAIDDAKRQVLVQAMYFSNKTILRALVRAQDRGVEVRAILSIGSERRRSKSLKYLVDNRIPVLIDARVKTQHNKIMIIDRDVVFTGSYNFTYAAQNKNAENLIAIRDSPDVVDRYVKNWEKRASASRPAVVDAKGGGRADEDDDDDE